MNGPYGLDYGIVMEMARMLGIETDQIFFEKLKAYEMTALEEIRKGGSDG